MNKRLIRLERMKKEYNLVGETNKTPCSKCGCCSYLVFYVPSVNSNGFYCRECGTWLRFENKNKPI